MPEAGAPGHAAHGQLAALAERHGVALGYADIWGKGHRASGATLAAILAAMGVRARDDLEAEAELRAEQARRLRRCFPAVVVRRVDRPPARLRLNLPSALDAEQLQWRLEEESGAAHWGEFSPGALPALEHAVVEGEAYAARELALPAMPAPGYHRLAILHARQPIGETLLVAAPGKCYCPPALQGGGRVWGAAVQLYGVRSGRNWGIGDFTDLRTIVEQWGSRGAGIVGVNPLHALFPHNSEHASPYSPSSRLFLNPLYLDVEALEDFRECEEVRATVRSAAFQARLKALREAELVDYAGVAQAKGEALERLYAHFRGRHLAHDTPRARAFREFQAREGEQLRRHALFEALQERLHREQPSIWGWPAWPEAFRDPASAAVARFAAEHAERVEYFEYLQWQTSCQLEAAHRCAVELGFGVGLYVDLAVSIDRGGAEAWANRELYASGASIGAPPDDFNHKGQNWGLPPFVPERLREAAYAPFVATLRASMRHAGALRIDHAMGLMRLFWVPPGAEATSGTYVHYPFDDLLGILALESHRNACLVIGEDLGTVPDAVRHAFREFGVLSYRVLFFERSQAGDFKPPAEYPAQALVTASTHDLPTLTGWWEGRDVELRHALGLVPAEQARRVLTVERSQDRARLLLALEREQLLPRGATANPLSIPKMTPEFTRCVHAYLARSPSQVLVVQLEDVLGAREQANLPATTGERHPNWRRKLGLALERWPEDARFVELADALARIRGRPRGELTAAPKGTSE
jgi:(1->4)-alpha-D-glucan 1-alpha-D-glucosylmutase